MMTNVRSSMVLILVGDRRNFNSKYW
jgi:hypothetical protein